MVRLAFDPEYAASAARPEMSVLEAADEMERLHGTRLFVKDHGRIVGILTEADIVTKVLAPGRRPDAVAVGEIMRASLERPDGSLLLEDPDDGDALREEEPPQTQVFQAILQGKCEECGLFNLDLEDAGGLLICPTCSERAEAR